MATSTRRRIREITALAEEAGLTVDGVTQNGHLHFDVRAPDGTPLKFVTSATVGDRRANLNARALLRRFSREHHA